MLRLECGKRAHRIAHALRPARGEHAAEREAEHESGQHQRAGPDRVAQQAAEGTEPEHFEQQRRRAGGEERERQPDRLPHPCANLQRVVSLEDSRMQRRLALAVLLAGLALSLIHI